MKKIITLVVGSSLAFLVSTSFADTKTDMNTKWTCSTNASSASTDADKAADDKMAKEQTTASSAFKVAAENCRDCTKITCEVSS